MVEADGEWHTTDNKLGSSNWIASNPKPLANPRPNTPPRSLAISRTSPQPASSQVTDKGKGPDEGKGPNVEVVVLDSDDEDEGRVKRELSPSFASGSSASLDSRAKSLSQTQTQTQVDDVIDLTLDSDEEPPRPPPPPLLPLKPAEKRKADEAGLSSPTETIWKKGRIGDSLLTLPSTSGTAGEYPSVSHHVIPLPQPARYPSQFTGSTLPPPVYNNYSSRSSDINQLAPIQGNPFSRSASHW